MFIVDSFHSFTESKFLIKKKPNEDDDQNANSISNKFSSSFIGLNLFKYFLFQS